MNAQLGLSQRSIMNAQPGLSQRSIMNAQPGLSQRSILGNSRLSNSRLSNHNRNSRRNSQLSAYGRRNSQLSAYGDNHLNPSTQNRVSEKIIWSQNNVPQIHKQSNAVNQSLIQLKSNSNTRKI